MVEPCSELWRMSRSEIGSVAYQLLAEKISKEKPTQCFWHSILGCGHTGGAMGRDALKRYHGVDTGRWVGGRGGWPGTHRISRLEHRSIFWTTIAIPTLHHFLSSSATMMSSAANGLVRINPVAGRRALATSAVAAADPIIMNRYSRTITQPKAQGASQVHCNYTNDARLDFRRLCYMRPKVSIQSPISTRQW